MSNNPYQAPKSNLELNKPAMPKTIQLCLLLLGLSLLINLLALFLLNEAELAVGIGLMYLAWFAIVTWFGWRISKGFNEQSTMLLLSLLIAVLAFIDDANQSLALGLLEALCFFGCFVLLRQPKSQAWLAAMRPESS